MVNQRKIGIILSYFVIIINILVGLIYVPLLTNNIGQNEFGIYRLMGSFIVYFSVLDFGINNIVINFYTKYRMENKIKKATNILFLSGVILVTSIILIIILSIILYPFLDILFKNSLNLNDLFSLKTIYFLLVLNLIFNFISNFANSIITSYEKFIFLKVILIAQTILQPIFVYLIILKTPTAIAIVIVQTIYSFIFLCIRWFFCFKYLNIKIKYYFWDKNIFTEMKKMSFHLFVVAIFDQVFWYGNQIILGSYSGAVSVAVYSIAVQIYMNYLPIASVFQSILMPKIVSMIHQNCDIEEFSKIFIRIGRLQYILLSWILLSFIIYGKEFIYIWVGPDYMLAYYIAIIIMIPFTINLIQCIGIIILQMKNCYGFRAIVYATLGIFNLIAGFLVVSSYGAIGCALITGICYLIGDGLIMNIYYSRVIKLDIKNFWIEIIKSIPIMIISFLIGKLIDDIFVKINYIYVLKIMIYSIIHMSLIYTLYLNSYEKNLLYQAYKKVKNIK